METERELKYSTTDDHVPSAAEISAALEGTELSVRSPTVEHYQDVYFDTADGALRRAGIALRRRHRPSGSFATFKGPVTLRDGLHSRQELESPLTAAGYWPDDVLSALPDGVEPRSLYPLAELDVRRVRLIVDLAGEPVADVAFDQVTCSAPDEVDASVTFHEVEIENLTQDPGAEVHMSRIAEAVGTLIPLTLSSFSKLERAQALLAAFA